MCISRWVISVLSTDYDLHEQRIAIINMLKKKDVTVSAFELADFPDENGIHSHDNCIKALDRADIAILVIDKRYGGIYFQSTSDDSNEESQHSVTEKEYLSMLEQGKPVFVFVSTESWNERHAYRVQYKAWAKKQGLQESAINEFQGKQDFDKLYQPTYVQSVGVIDFIQLIQDSYSKFSSSKNWISQYNSTADLIEKIIGKLSQHTRAELDKIVEKQTEKLKSRHTSTGLGCSLEDVINKGFYIEPSYAIESGKLTGGDTLAYRLLNSIKGNKSILVFGEAGYGKTTVLAKTYLLHAEEYKANNAYHIPFYLWLKKQSSSYHFNLNIYIQESFIYDRKYLPYPFLDLSNIKPYFYFDGFDELAEKMTPEDVERICKSNMFRSPVLLTCRNQYAYRYINNSSFTDMFSTRVNIKDWNPEMASRYIDNFCQIQNMGDDFKAAIHQLILNNNDLNSIIDSPLLITMLLWIVERRRMTVPETIHTRIELFQACFAELASRELEHAKISNEYVNDLITLWSLAAWEVYYCKLNDKDQHASYRTLIPHLKSLLPDLPFDCSVKRFEALFDSYEDKIFGTFHEQFLEYLVANACVDACRLATYPYPEFLEYVVRPEINRYFRAIWSGLTANDKVKVLTNLFHLYSENLIDDSYKSVSKRVHATYHICRFNVPDRKKIMDMLFTKETHVSVRLSLYFGAIKLGQLDREQEFFELLENDPAYNDANRGYHLAYYGDAAMGTTMPFKDYPEREWSGTLVAFLRHFNSKDVEHYFLRRIDIVTMKHLIIARKSTSPLTAENLAHFIQKVESSSFASDYPEFQAITVAALSDLQQVFHGNYSGTLKDADEAPVTGEKSSPKSLDDSYSDYLQTLIAKGEIH